jgi:D-galactarate/Altronate dehydratase, C-terminal
VLHLFPTGQGNVIGHPLEPVIKLTANPLTAQTMAEHIDLDCSGLLTRAYDLSTAGGMLMEICDRTVNGRLTCAEAIGHHEFALTRLHQSAGRGGGGPALPRKRLDDGGRAWVTSAGPVRHRRFHGSLWGTGGGRAGGVSGVSAETPG